MVMGDISILEKDCRDQDAHHSLVNVLYQQPSLAFLHMFLSINMISSRVLSSFMQTSLPEP